ncbi:ABC transporter ATP-binding protein [Actinobacteria bacterium YIM 96077]|uniref:ABC transporter ATP-binding protein n=1 Tax=Phytoactinopolyspora halophila TaxID=1981511 RepID=A0A329QTD0_9ACTN|nr:ABC transporter ATP-binding protein [Phytoactinopolyspora halophila]AYY13872.1 ABC transporter ATP-binding protein [Actinobacteria bacterium YIM 96077]RAW15585.1 ABC transporter ATP-binding protein [Phytoactinopolyspora halophila]
MSAPPEPAVPASHADAVLAIRGLDKRFGGVRAVADLDLDIGHGERVSVIGPNGAGKSTLFNVIAGDHRPTGGRIVMFGTDITGESTRKRAHRGLARTFQTSKLFSTLTVGDNLYLALCGRPGSVRRLRNANRDRARRARAAEFAERVGLGERLRTEVGELSHGEQRQLELVMALATQPRLLMLDEPAAGLSPAERGGLMDVLTSLDRDVTLLLIEHDMDIALVVGERVVVMADGEKVLEGGPDTVRSSDLVRRIYLGGAPDGR